VLSGRGDRVVGEGKPVRLFLAGPAAVFEGSGAAAVPRRLAIPAAGVDNLDGTPAVSWRSLHLVLLARSGVLDDVGTGLAERQGNVGARIRSDSESLQAAVEDLAAYGHADGISGKVKHHLDFHATHL